MLFSILVMNLVIPLLFTIGLIFGKVTLKIGHGKIFLLLKP